MTNDNYLANYTVIKQDEKYILFLYVGRTEPPILTSAEAKRLRSDLSYQGKLTCPEEVRKVANEIKQSNKKSNRNNEKTLEGRLPGLNTIKIFSSL